MSSKIIKTRFAPSPTGMMHVGNFRTALYSYLWARKNNGRFIIRIEDTDKQRQVKDAEQAIFRVLKWAGLEHDEGPDIGGPYGPYRQSERLTIYQKYIQQLLNSGQAYYCFCSAQRLEKMRLGQQARGEPVFYDRHCLKLNQSEIQAKLKRGEAYVIRQKIDINGQTKFKDLIRGDIVISNNILDDSVLIKSDGYPTYNFANVIDDHLMQITHIIRGEEYINSTPKYIQLYKAFGWQIPEHAHLSLILNKQRAKLSKRDGDVSVEEYISQGYLPETIINFVAFLGWNPGGQQELFSLAELVKQFDFSKVNKSGAIFDKVKLDWMNGHYIRGKTLNKLTELCLPYLQQAGYVDEKLSIKNYELSSRLPGGFGYIKAVVGLEQDRLKKLSEISQLTKYFFSSPEYEPNLLIWKKADQQTTKKRLEFLIDYLSDVPDENWTRSALEQALIEQIKEKCYNNGEVLWPMRVALSGSEKSPSPFELAEVLGKKEAIYRLKQAVDRI